MNASRSRGHLEVRAGSNQRSFLGEPRVRVPGRPRAIAAVLATALTLLVTAAASVQAEATRAWTAGVRAALPAEGTTQTVHRGFEGSVFLDFRGDEPLTVGLEAGGLRDPGGQSTPRDEATLIYVGPHVRGWLGSAVIPAYLEAGLIGGRYDLTSAFPEIRGDESEAVIGGYVGAAVRFRPSPRFGVDVDARYTRLHGPSLPRGRDNVDWWGLGVSLLTWR